MHPDYFANKPSFTYKNYSDTEQALSPVGLGTCHVVHGEWLV